MTAMFPDSGVPPSDARNSIHDPNTVNCDELWYSTSRCQPRFDPAAANAVLSELINIVNGAGIAYDCNYLDRVQLAIKYLIQRGTVYYSAVIGGSSGIATLDPPITGYNEGMLFKGIPITTNPGPANLNINNQGAVPILRNDGQQVVKDDLPAGIPYLGVYHAGAFYIPYPLPSQLPHILIGNISAWVRTDGNDNNDGTANSPDKAFRTIQGAYNVNCAKYVVTSQFSLQILLGIPGTYEGASFNGFVGKLYVIGNQGAPQDYRINSWIGGSEARNFGISASQVLLYGMTLLLDRTSGYRHWCLACTAGGTTNLLNMRFESTTSNTNSAYIVASAAHVIAIGDTAFVGNGATVLNIISMQTGGILIGNPSGTLSFTNINSQGPSFQITWLSQFSYSGQAVSTSGCTGTKYLVDDNSIAAFGSQPVPGNVAGSAATGGQIASGGTMALEVQEGDIMMPRVGEEVPTTSGWQSLVGYQEITNGPLPPSATVATAAPTV